MYGNVLLKYQIIMRFQFFSGSFATRLAAKLMYAMFVKLHNLHLCFKQLNFTLKKLGKGSYFKMASEENDIKLHVEAVTVSINLCT